MSSNEAMAAALVAIQEAERPCKQVQFLVLAGQLDEARQYTQEAGRLARRASEFIQLLDHLGPDLVNRVEGWSLAAGEVDRMLGNYADLVENAGGQQTTEARQMLERAKAQARRTGHFAWTTWIFPPCEGWKGVPK